MLFFLLLLAQAPTGIIFTPSVDHASLTGYKGYVVIGTNTVRIADLGKPAPDATGTIRVSTPTAL